MPLATNLHVTAQCGAGTDRLPSDKPSQKSANHALSHSSLNPVSGSPSSPSIISKKGKSEMSPLLSVLNPSSHCCQEQSAEQGLSLGNSVTIKTLLSTCWFHLREVRLPQCLFLLPGKVISSSVFIISFFNVYLFILREGERMQAGEGQRQRKTETENPKQDLHCQHRAQCGTRSQEPSHEIMTSAKIKSQTLNWLSHPGTLINIVFLPLPLPKFLGFCVRINEISIQRWPTGVHFPVWMSLEGFKERTACPKSGFFSSRTHTMGSS